MLEFLAEVGPELPWGKKQGCALGAAFFAFYPAP